MVSALISVALLAGLGQAVTPPGPEMKTYILTLQDGTKVPVFWDSKQEDKDWVHLQIDEPWLPQQPAYWSGKASEIVSKRLEIPSMREQRVREGWAAQGFVEINGRHVEASDKAWSDRARELAGVTAPGGASAPAPAAETPALAPPDPQAQASAPQRGLVWPWAGYVGIGAVAIALIIVIARTMVVGENS